jgi:2-hydroxy-3-keto-5-methylthiopentenyl-1-phosphate phosphatase
MKAKIMKTLVQCDFDGTITEKDVSFELLDLFANGDWRRLLGEYREGKISVGRFNTNAFAMVKASKQSLLEVVKGKVKIREGFGELVNFCQRSGFRLVIVSNGLDFYIEAILKDLGLESIKVFAAKTRFSPQGIQVQYIGPDGRGVEDSFKEMYVSSFLASGYRVIYIGDGISDIPPARKSHHIFATGELLTRCQQMNVDCTPFVDFNDIVRGLELL